MLYDDHVFRTVRRKWFGLPAHMGGEGNNVSNTAGGRFTFGTTDATSKVHVKRWYPGGPIKILKIGYMNYATIVPGSTAYTDKVPVRFYTRGASASVLGTLSVDISGTAVAAFSSASLTSLTVSKCKTGEYISIKTGTPQTGDGTAANTATSSGTVAFFIDYVPTFGTEWADRN